MIKEHPNARIEGMSSVVQVFTSHVILLNCPSPSSFLVNGKRCVSKSFIYYFHPLILIIPMIITSYITKPHLVEAAQCSTKQSLDIFM
jgi:hypothetical protein